MLRHVLKLSDGEATRWVQTAKMLRDLVQVRATYRAGEAGPGQLRRLARAHANPRVRSRLPQSEAILLNGATSLPYKHFERLVDQWVRLADEDGAFDATNGHHEGRDAKLLQGYNGSWQLTARCGSLQGAVMRDILEHFADTEFQTDWAQARAEHGDRAKVEHLARNHAQRRFDALLRLFQRGASAPPGAKTPEVVTNIVVDAATHERMVTKLAGGKTDPADPDSGSYCCGTTDGDPMDPTEAAVASLIGHVRRVIIDAESVVVDLGRKRRLFTGSARLAAMIGHNECIWPGCHTPVSRCQVDHIRPWADGGRTDAHNAAPLCGRHNRLKEQRYRTWKRSAGGHDDLADGESVLEDSYGLAGPL